MTEQQQQPREFKDSFTQGMAWGALVNQMEYDERLESLPSWTCDVFHAMALAIEDLPDEYRNKVVNAALQKWTP